MNVLIRICHVSGNKIASRTKIVAMSTNMVIGDGDISDDDSGDDDGGDDGGDE